MKISKFPYFFYLLQDLDYQDLNKKITIKDKEYSLEKSNINIVLILKYIPIFLFFSIVFNQYDFML